MRDLRSHRLMMLKAALFVVMGLIAAAAILLELPTWRTAALLAILIWAFCRAYYFAFYVLEKYIDPSYRFAGLFSAARYLFTRRPRS